MVSNSPAPNTRGRIIRRVAPSVVMLAVFALAAEYMHECRIETVSAELIAAVRKGNLKGVEHALGAGADPNAKERPKSRDKMWARLAHFIHKEPSEEDYEETALCAPMAQRDPIQNTEIVAALLKRGADPNLRCCGDTPLNMAASWGFTETVQLLLNHGADTRIAAADGWTPLHSAIFTSDNTSVIRLLLTHGANVNAANGDGETPLYEAVDADQADYVALLLHHGANPNIGARDGTTALDIATNGGDENIVRLLISVGAKRRAKHGASPTNIRAHR